MLTLKQIRSLYQTPRGETLSGRFALYYADREPEDGPSQGLMGLAEPQIIEVYRRGLDKTYELLEVNHGWPEPAPDPATGKVPVYVFDTATCFPGGYPFTAPYFADNIKPSDHRLRSAIGLRTELAETTWLAAFERAEIDASHEAAHAYVNEALFRRYGFANFTDWFWFNEATAVFIEWTLHPDKPDHHYFARDWVQCPGRRLEQKWELEPVGYESAWFVEYLVRHYGWDLLRNVWHDVNPKETPIQAIDRYFHENTTIRFRDAAHDAKDVFGSGYAVDSFLTARVCPDLHARFKNRLSSGTFVITPGKPKTLSGVLEPLACRYYKLNNPANNSGFKVTVESAIRGKVSGLKAHVFAVAAAKQLGDKQPLVANGTAARTTTRLTATVASVAGAEYHVLAVANVHCVAESPKLLAAETFQVTVV